MCGRFALTISPAVLARFFELSDIPGKIEPRYNIAPGQSILAVVDKADQAGREWRSFQWGLIPSWVKGSVHLHRMINARSETVTEKPAFRQAFQKRRCLIPADGFYEWQKLVGKKQPYFVHLLDQSPLALAGLWESRIDPAGTIIDTCAILTTAGNELMRPIHDRMPVIISPADYQRWLDVQNRSEEVIEGLLRPYSSEKMAAHPVSTFVNNIKNDDSSCLDPIELPCPPENGLFQGS